MPAHEKVVMGAELAVVVSAAVRPLSTGRVETSRVVRDIEYGGGGVIFGTTKIKAAAGTLPTRARVVLMHQHSKLPVRETWSDPVTGYFAFSGIDTRQQFITYAEDAAGNFRPVAANKLEPKVV
jgi:hypothetical protein